MTLLALCLIAVLIGAALIVVLSAARLSGDISQYEYELEAKERAERSVSGDKATQ